MNENARIYICTHTDFISPVKDKVYAVADSRKLFKSDRAKNGMDGLFYSELMTYHLLAQQNIPEIVGFCGYRKYFAFLDQVPDLNDVLRRYGCIATTPYTVKGSVYDHYANCFCFADMDVMKAVVHGRYPWLYDSFSKMLTGRNLYICNMFIMRKKDFVEMMEVVWNCLDDWLAVVGMDIRKRIQNHSDLYLNKRGRASQIEHQFRIGGNLGERIVSAYLSCKFPNLKTYDIIFTEDVRPHRPLLE